MKLTTFILIIALAQVSAKGFGQRITLNTNSTPIEQVLQSIREQSGYGIFYDAKDLDNRKITLTLNNVSVEEAIKEVTKDLPLSYKIVKTNIVLIKMEPSLLDKAKSLILNSYTGESRYQDLKGRVTDEQGKPLPNASIRIKGSGFVTNTNEKGEFVIKDVADDAVLVVSYVGYKELEISVKGSVIPLEIKLNQITGELEEVKVVYNTGYQELNKERSTGSFVQIDNELFNRAVGPNVLDRIYNVTPGLIAQPGGLNPGKTGIVIRGFSTINAGTDPLIIVDNFPYEGDLSTLNPNDVESVTVLKDAAASSIWGVRAGNGVIVITTKRGRFNQRANIAVNSNITISQKPNLFYIPYMSSRDIIDFEKQQFATGMYNDYDDLYPSLNYFPVLPQSIEILLAARKKSITTSDYNAVNDPAVNAQLEELASNDIRNDINKHLLQNGLNQQYALNISGGGDVFNYYASLGYDRDKGNDIKNENRRLSVNFTNTWRPIKNLTISASLAHTRSINTNQGVAYRNFLAGNQMSIYTRLSDDEGNSLAIPRFYRTTYVDTASYPALLDWHYRPLEDYRFNNNKNNQYDTRVSLGVNYALKPWLKAEFQYQNQTTLSDSRSQNGMRSFSVRDVINKFMDQDAFGVAIYPYPKGDKVDFINGVFKTWNMRGSLKFDHRINNHQVGGLFGVEIRENQGEINYNSLFGFDSKTNTSTPVSFTQQFPTRPSGSGVVAALNDPQGNLARNGSLFANADYNYNGKYLATISGRMDQSNFFGVKANLRKVPLWSTGIAWNAHLEDFYNINWLSQLKLKISYGYTGNTNSGASSYATFRTLRGSESVPARNIVYGEILTPNNPQLRWERVKIINAGLEFGFKNNRISGSLDFYNKNGIDLLGPILIDPTVGVSSFTGNRSSMKVKGMDFVLNTRNLITDSFLWETTLLISLNKDQITAYNSPFGTSVSASTYAQQNVVEAGDPLYAIYSYKWAGLDSKTGDPRIYLADTVSSYVNIDNAIKQDLTFDGQRNPKIFGSIRNSFSYKQISVSANITYQFGHHFRRNSVSYSNLVSSGWNEHADYALRWRKEGDELFNNVPSLLTTGDLTRRDAAYLFSNSLIEKGDHVRLQDIQLSYKLSSEILRRFPFKQISLYAYAANLGLIWRANKIGLDPNAFTFGSVPTPRTVAFGLNANF